MVFAFETWLDNNSIVSVGCAGFDSEAEQGGATASRRVPRSRPPGSHEETHSLFADWTASQC